MTKVGRLFEEEKQQAVATVRGLFEEEKQQAVAAVREVLEREKEHEARKVAALKLLLKGSSPQEVSKTTGLPLKEIEELLK